MFRSSFPKIILSALTIIIVSNLSNTNKTYSQNKKSAKKQTYSPPQIARKALQSIIVITSIDKRGKESLGTGFYITPAMFVTNYHVVKGASRVTIRKILGPVNEVEIDPIPKFFDDKSDIATMHAPQLPSPFLPLAKRSSLPIGSTIYVAGNPKGFEGTFSNGIISGYRHDPDLGLLIQITAPVSPGSSGSPVINQSGEVVGIVTLTYKDAQNLNFATPVETLRVKTFEQIDDILSRHQDHKSQAPTKPQSQNFQKRNIPDNAINVVDPVYPKIAVTARAQGAVQVQVTISDDGRVVDARIVSGHPLLREACIRAAKQWRFQPMKQSSPSAKVEEILTFYFSLNQ